MTLLNLPPFEARLQGPQDRRRIFDILRRRYVALTPEEWVRQNFIHYLTDHLNYPSTLLANEVKLQVGKKTLRADSVLYDTQLRPRIIIEYKAPHIKITQKVFDQIVAYNMQLHVDYLIVSNGLSHFCCKITDDGKNYLFIGHIPTYEEILQK